MKKAVQNWLDRISHYVDDKNTRFLKIKITYVHLSGSIDEAFCRNFQMHVSSDSLSIKLWNGCSVCLVDPRKPKEWVSFLAMHRIKLSLHDNKNDLPKDTGKMEFFDSDTTIETDDDEDVEEEDEMDLVSDEESVCKDSMDEIIHNDIDLCSGDNSPLPTLRQMDAFARELDSIPSPSSHGYSAASSDADSIRSF